MKRECAVPMCQKVYSNTFRKSEDKTTYFSFPTNEAYKKVWAKLVSRREKTGELWMPGANSKICSIHFEESQFRYWASYKRLLPNALPTIFPGYPEKILKRQGKIIENFRKNHPLGEETLEKNIPWTKRKGNGSANEDDNNSQGQEDMNDTLQSGSETDDRNTRRDNQEEVNTKRRLSAEDSEVSKLTSEESKPFKKRRIDTELQRNGDVVFEEESSPEHRKPIKNQKLAPAKSKATKSEIHSSGQQSKNQTAGSPNEPVVKIQRLEQREIENMLGRGKRAKKRSVKLEYDSEDSRKANDDPIDEDYVPQEEISKKIPEKGNSSRAKEFQPRQKLEEERDEFGDSKYEKKLRLMQQQIKWKDERLFTLNQKAVSERNARLKAEKELEFIKNYMKSISLDIPELDLKSVNSDRKNDVKPSSSEDLKNKAAVAKEVEMANSIKILKEEIAFKDKCLAELRKKNAGSVRNDFGALEGNWHPKNRYTQTVKRILEDSMEGDDQALFLLDQLESYGKDDVEEFRLTTIKKCVEWKLLNARGYDSVRNMGILALPSTKVLREHVDILTETGVTAVEDIGLESDLGEVEEEMAEEKFQIGSKHELPPITNKVQQKKDDFLDSVLNAEDDEMLKLIGKTRQKFMKELPSSKAKEDGQRKGRVGTEPKNTIIKKIQQRETIARGGELDKKQQSGESNQPFRMELSSGILIEEIQPAVENRSVVKPKKTSPGKDYVDHNKSKKLIDSKKIVISPNEDKSGQSKEASKKDVEATIDEDPTSENLIQGEDSPDIDDMMEHASEEVISEDNAVSEEVLMEEDEAKPASQDTPKPSSEDAREKKAAEDGGEKTLAEDAGENKATEDGGGKTASEDIVKPAAEDIVEPASEDLVENVSAGSVEVYDDTAEHDPERQTHGNSSKDEINEEELPPGSYVEEVQSSDDDSS